METEKTAAERRKELATLLFCQSYLYYHDMRIAITREQIDSVEIKYQDKL